MNIKSHMQTTDLLYLERLVSIMKPSEGDPTYLVLKAHLLSEEVLVRFIESQAHNSSHVSDARLGFTQLVALCRSFNRYSGENWWGWVALKKLNTLRNLLAHNLEPKELTVKIDDFSNFVAVAIGATTESEIGREYERISTNGTHPFVLALVALLIALSVNLGFNPEEQLNASY